MFSPRGPLKQMTSAPGLLGVSELTQGAEVSLLLGQMLKRPQVLALSTCKKGGEMSGVTLAGTWTPLTHPAASATRERPPRSQLGSAHK